MYVSSKQKTEKRRGGFKVEKKKGMISRFFLFEIPGWNAQYFLLLKKFAVNDLSPAGRHNGATHTAREKRFARRRWRG